VHPESDMTFQFVSHELSIKFLETAMDQNLMLLKDIDDKLRKQHEPDSTLGKYLANHPMYFKDSGLTLEKLDTFRMKLNVIFYADIRLAKQFRDSTEFDDNKVFFNSLYNLLHNYEAPYLDPSKCKRL
jgi:hypothetical protein